MKDGDRLFSALRLDREDRKKIAAATGIPEEMLSYWQKHSLLPSRYDLRKLCAFADAPVAEVEGLIGGNRNNPPEAADTVKHDRAQHEGTSQLEPAFRTELGELHHGDCLQIMRRYDARSFDMIFADPPFNLNKAYPSKINDERDERDYLSWCYQWLDECIRLLKPSASLFVYNLPRWNIRLADFLLDRLSFRDWITIDLKGHLPLAGRLYPSHYSLIYFCNGERPTTFHPDRLPMRTCPSCHADLVDYGGYKGKMNPKGITLTDVWTDIPLVRHSKYKSREGANELSVKLLDRVIEMATNEGDRIFDPFGGSGTTFLVAELKSRRWAGCEVGPIDDIVERLKNKHEEKQHLSKIRSGYNHLFSPSVAREREKRNLWTADSVRNGAGSAPNSKDADSFVLEGQ